MKPVIRIVLLATLALVPTSLAARPDPVGIPSAPPIALHDPCPTC